MASNFFKRFILETIDDMTYASRKFGEKIGIQPLIDTRSYSLQAATYYALFRNRYDFQIFNPEMIPLKDGFLIACNHQSESDPLFLGDAIWHHTNRQSYFLAKSELYTDPLMNMFTRMNKCIFVRRGDSDETALQKCRQVLYEGNPLIIFPEGTLNPGNGKFLEFKSGVVRLALDCQVPILPAAVYGSDRVFGKGAKMPQLKGKVRVSFGKLIPPEKLIKNLSNLTNSNTIDALELTKATRKVQREVEKVYMDIWMQEQQAKQEINATKAASVEDPILN